MGKASSAKKVARAARAGGTRKSGQRRPMGFPIAIVAVLVFGLVLVLFARDRRNANAFPRANADHVHSAYDTYVCVQDTAAQATTTTTAPPASDADGDHRRTTTTAATSTTVAAPGDVAGQYLAAVHRRAAGHPRHPHPRRRADPHPPVHRQRRRPQGHARRVPRPGRRVDDERHPVAARPARRSPKA